MQGLMELIASQQATFMEWRGMQMAQDERRIADEATAQSQKTLLMQNVAEARQSGGIYGYEQERALSPEEQQFYEILRSFKRNSDTSDELFRQGINSVEIIMNMEPEKLKSAFHNIQSRKSCSPSCPDRNEIFLGATFESQMSVVIEWAKYQKVIGGSPTAVAWNADATAYKLTLERINYHRQIRDSEGTDDISLPGPLKEMKKFKEFSDSLVAYLRTKRGSCFVPLCYVIRKTEEVTDVERRAFVGINGRYKNWDEHSIRCAVMKGPHWQSDNADFWQILGRLVRDGPGWDFIRGFEKRGDGDGRGAYLALYNQAFQHTNVRLIKSQARDALRELRFDGERRNFGWEKYVRNWYRNVETLKTYDACPPEHELVEEFCKGISDPRLTSGIANVLMDGSTQSQNLNNAQIYLNNILSVTPKKRDRNVSSFNFDKNKRQKKTSPSFSGKIEGKRYSASEWRGMSKAQQDKVRELRQAKYKNKKANVSEVSTAANEDDDDEKASSPQFGRKAHSRKKK